MISISQDIHNVIYSWVGRTKRVNIKQQTKQLLQDYRRLVLEIDVFLLPLHKVCILSVPQNKFSYLLFGKYLHDKISKKDLVSWHRKLNTSVSIIHHFYFEMKWLIEVKGQESTSRKLKWCVYDSDNTPPADIYRTVYSFLRLVIGISLWTKTIICYSSLK